MIRFATMQDVDAIAAMAAAFYPASGYAEICEMDPVMPAGLAIVCMSTGVVLVAEVDGKIVGMVVIHVTPFEFNPKVLLANELAFWIEPEHRGGMLAVRMVRAAVEACEARGVRALRMARLQSSGEAIGKVYEKLGFAESETYYTKVL